MTTPEQRLVQLGFEQQIMPEQLMPLL